ncbi:hypothetical protein ACFC6U_38615 [Kitasatospora purpeofusca]|uniref:hypothetical protein n=1 Tax=Kitasatospora purpeofusca TaxID=67352 RepID=UPI0035E0D727
MTTRPARTFRRHLQAMRHSRLFRPLARTAHAVRRELTWLSGSLAQALSERAYTVVFEYPDEPRVHVYHVSARSLGAAVRQAEYTEAWRTADDGWPGDSRPAPVAIASEGWWTYSEDRTHGHDDAPW